MERRFLLLLMGAVPTLILGGCGFGGGEDNEDQNEDEGDDDRAWQNGAIPRRRPIGVTPHGHVRPLNHAEASSSNQDTTAR